jgi:hypothetical protein
MAELGDLSVELQWLDEPSFLKVDNRCSQEDELQKGF